MTNEEKAQEIVNKNFEWISNFFEENNLSKEDRNQIRFKMYSACQEMAEWKDDIVRGFLFELSMLLTEPKTDIERAICFALPMSGLNVIDEVGDFLREKFWEYEHKGTILKDK